jgi:hypothetical protein
LRAVQQQVAPEGGARAGLVPHRHEIYESSAGRERRQRSHRWWGSPPCPG